MILVEDFAVWFTKNRFDTVIVSLFCIEGPIMSTLVKLGEIITFGVAVN